MEWNYDKTPKTSYETQMYKTILKITKSHTLAEKGSRTLGLFDFLKKHKFSDPSELRRHVLLKKGTPYFSKHDSKKVWTFFSQTGGVNDKGPFDALIERWLNFMFILIPSENVKEFLSTVGKFAFPLQTIENDMPGIGQVIGFSVDVVAQMNKIAAKLSQQYTPQIMGLIPIPEASTIGIVVGYMISTMFIFFNMLIFVTRHHFGEAFTQSMALIPFVGLALQNFAETGDKVVEKFAAKRQHLIDQLKGPNGDGMFAFLGDIIQNYTLDPMDSGEGDAQKAEMLKQTLNQGIEGLKSKAVELSQNPAISGLLDKAKGHLDTFKSKATELSQHPSVSGLLDKAKTITNSKIGKGLSNKKPGNIKRWKTKKILKK